jgi:hypothetical protein
MKPSVIVGYEEEMPTILNIAFRTCNKAFDTLLIALPSVLLTIIPLLNQTTRNSNESLQAVFLAPVVANVLATHLEIQNRYADDHL